ncbi:MAG: hypothetical protein WBP34_00850 [Thermoanaerobaculia bacterium]
MSNKEESVEFGGPAVYRIVVQGCLRDDSRLGDMRIVSTSDEAEAPVTTLEGRLRDQSELSGVLNTLHGYHLSILTVEHEGDESKLTARADAKNRIPAGLSKKDGTETKGE